MRLPRVFCQRQGDELILDPQDQQHLRKVLRLRPGAALLASDGQGRDFRAELTPLGARVLEELPNGAEPALQLWLLVALARGERFERLLEKAAELGVAGITPVLTQHGVVKDPGEQRQDRWQRLVREAAALAGRARIPQVDAPVPLARALSHDARHRVMFTHGQPAYAGAPAESAAVLIGPEGGFSPAEEEEARAAGWTLAGLGPRNLRVETAATAALVLLLARGGELGPGCEG